MNRLGARKTLPAELQSQYYSSWHYLAIHLALSVPSLQTKSELAHHFQLPLRKVTAVLEFLVHAGLAIGVGDRFEYGPLELRLGSSSSDILKHHSNWRVQALDSLERETNADLHYSGVYTIAAKDAAKIKELLLQSIQANLNVVYDSKEETVYGICIDFFDLKKAESIDRSTRSHRNVPGAF